MYPLCKVTKKTGHHPLLAFLMLLPVVNIIILYMLASDKWPIEYENEALIQENTKLKEKIKESEPVT